MDYNLAEIRRNVALDLLDDEEYDPGIIDRAINRAQRQIFNTFELTFMEKIFSGVVPEGSTIFRYPPDVALAQDHVVSSPDGSQRSIKSGYLPFNQFNAMYPTPANNAPSSIVHWTSYGGNIITSAPTDQEYTLDIFYIKKPKKLLADGDVPDIPEEFAELLELGAYLRITKRNEDTDLTAEARNDYNILLSQLAERYGGRMSGPMKMGNMQRRV